MVTVVILVILGLCVLAGYYRGVVYSALSIGLTVLSFFLALLLIPVVATPVRHNADLCAQRLEIDGSYVVPVDKDSASLRIVKALYKIDQR